MIRPFLMVLLFFVAPLPLFAFSITEIMYDAPGTGSGYEWVEIYADSFSYSLSDVTFFEQDINHGLVEYQGGMTLSPGMYAIVSDKPDLFLASYPFYTGILVDSSFSLSNTGELLEFRLGDRVLDSFSYTAGPDTDGTGSTLQRSGSSWVSGVATPGSGFSGSSKPAPRAPVSDDQATQETSSASSNTSSIQSGFPAPTLFSGFLEFPSVLIAGSDFIIRPHVTSFYDGEERDRTSGVTYVNFGDGVVRENDRIEPFSHRYRYPGVYTLYFEYSKSDMRDEPDLALSYDLTVLENPLVLARDHTDSGYVLNLMNTSQSTLDISDWFTSCTDGDLYVFPPHSYIQPNGTLILDSKRTACVYDVLHPVVLSFPSSSPAFILDPIFIEETRQEHIQSSAPQEGDSLEASSPVVDTSGQDGLISEPESFSASTLEHSQIDYYQPVWMLGGVLLVLVGGLLFLRTMVAKRQLYHDPDDLIVLEE